MIKVLMLALLMLELLVGCALAKDEGKPTDINVEVGKVTEVVFPQKVVKVIKGGQPDSILVEVLDNSVYLLPKTEKPADIFVTTSSGNSYPLTLHLSLERDIKIQIASKGSNSSRNVYTDVMDLMKDLLLHKEPSMATVLPQEGKVFLTNQEIEITVDKAYELGEWKAYVFTARNLIHNAVIVPIEQLALPNLLAVSADQDMLLAKGEQGDRVKVYMITGQ
jgi:hypothetical protein